MDTIVLKQTTRTRNAKLLVAGIIMVASVLFAVWTASLGLIFLFVTALFVGVGSLRNKDSIRLDATAGRIEVRTWTGYSRIKVDDLSCLRFHRDDEGSVTLQIVSKSGRCLILPDVNLPDAPEKPLQLVLIHWLHGLGFSCERRRDIFDDAQACWMLSRGNNSVPITGDHK